MLDRQVLVLNRLWQAVNVCSGRRAFSLLCQGHAQVVYEDGNNNFLTHNFSSWREFSQREPEGTSAPTPSLPAAGSPASPSPSFSTPPGTGSSIPPATTSSSATRTPAS